MVFFSEIFSSTHFGTYFTVSDIHISFFSFMLFQFNVIYLEGWVAKSEGWVAKLEGWVAKSRGMGG